MGKSKIQFYAKITTPDGREITRRVEEDIPDYLNPHDLDEFMSSFDDYEQHVLKARNGICKEITQAWLEEQAKKGAILPALFSADVLTLHALLRATGNCRKLTS